MTPFAKNEINKTDMKYEEEQLNKNRTETI